MRYLDEKAAQCGYADYVSQHLKFPPQGPLPLPGNSTEFDPDCNIWMEIFTAALIINPAFNVYRIFDTVRSDGAGVPTGLSVPYCFSSIRFSGTSWASRKLSFVCSCERGG